LGFVCENTEKRMADEDDQLYAELYGAKAGEEETGAGAAPATDENSENQPMATDEKPSEADLKYDFFLFGEDSGNEQRKLMDSVS
jgi:hypothetical protein